MHPCIHASLHRHQIGPNSKTCPCLCMNRRLHYISGRAWLEGFDKLWHEELKLSCRKLHRLRLQGLRCGMSRAKATHLGQTVFMYIYIHTEQVRLHITLLKTQKHLSREQAPNPHRDAESHLAQNTAPLNPDRKAPLNPKPQTLNPKPEAPHPKPETP